MAKCTHCGREFNDKLLFCPGCGARVPEKKIDTAQMFREQAKSMANEFKNEAINAAHGLKHNPEQSQNTVQTDNSGEYVDTPSKIVCAVMYLFRILFFVPLLLSPRTRFNMFHSNQALVLLLLDIVLGIAVGIVDSILLFIPIIGWIAVCLLSAAVTIIMLIFSFIGIINVLNGKMRPLPIIGRITIIK